MVSYSPRRLNDAPRGRFGSSSWHYFFHFLADASQPRGDRRWHKCRTPESRSSGSRITGPEPRWIFAKLTRRCAGLPAVAEASPLSEPGLVEATALFSTEIGSAQQGIERIDPILRSLNADVVGNSVGRVHPEAGGHLIVAAQGYQQAAGNVALGQASISPALTLRIDIHEQLRLAAYLCGCVPSGRAGDARDAIPARAGQSCTRWGRHARTPVNRWARKAKIQDLVGNVSRLEEEHHVREALLQ